MKQSTAVGVIGLGLLGEGLARRLLQGGYEVVGFDIDSAKIDKLASLGGIPATSASAVAQSCGPIVLAVFSTEQVEAIVEGDLLPVLGENSGRTLLCASTCDPDRVAALGERLAARGVELLETPVSGSSGQVSRGEGVGLIGGEAGVLAKVQPIVQTMFPTFLHVGKVGDGGRAKLAVNLILGLNRLALAEGLVFAQRLGLDIGAFLKIARGSACYSQVMDIKGDKMVRGDFVAEGRITQHLKDVQLMLDQARLVKQRLPLLEIHADVLQACVRHGEGDLDNSIVIEEIRRRRTG
jgi:3-hydroxyisobutyrate dehydrogenase-like beta-hydroxyacid dehydrogenase